MARIKSVYSSDMVAHLWANRVSHDVRTSTDSLHTRGGNLHSYSQGYLIGAFMDAPKSGPALILWNAGSHSPTTTGHSALAWRALTSAQRAGSVRVPALYERAVKSPEGIYALGDLCVKAAVNSILQAQKARGRRANYIQEARAHLESARAIWTYTGHKKSVAGLPDLPIDVDKAGADDVLKYIGAAEFKAEAAALMVKAKECLASAKDTASQYARPEADSYFTARRVCDIAVASVRACDGAAGKLKSAGARMPASLHMVKREADAIVDTHSPAALAEGVALDLAELKDTIRRVKAALAQVGREKRKSDKFYKFQYSRNSLSYAAERMPSGAHLDAAGLQYWPNPKERAARVAEIAALNARVARITAGNGLKIAIDQTAATLENYREAMATGARSWPVVNAVNGLRRAVKAGAGGTGPGEYWADKAAALITACGIVASEEAARARVLNAEVIQKWRAGEAVRVPHEVPAMIRVKGEIVETSKGASVPLSHALRLVRIAQRVAAQGGCDYLKNDGPAVGYFRVNSISADMGAVIGCHEISPEEAARALVMLEATGATAAPAEVVPA